MRTVRNEAGGAEEDGLDTVLGEIGCDRSAGEAPLGHSAGPCPATAEAAPALRIRVGGTSFVADPSGALWHEEERTLLVADLHLEKASRYAMRGQMLPPYDTAETLRRLSLLVERLAPRRVVCLGDSFHDRGGPGRLRAADRAVITDLAARAHFIWIAGNHDPDLPADLPGERADQHRLAGIDLRHEPSPGQVAGAEICGHLHPVARIMTKRGSLRRRCFAGDGARLVMPAFGALTGGLNILDAAFAGLFRTSRPDAFLIGRAQVFAIPGRHLQGG